MNFDIRDVINPEEMVQSAAEGAQRSVGGFFGRNWLWMLLIAIAGPIVASNFRDRLPEGMGWLTGIGDFFIGLLSRIPGIGNFFGGMIQRQAENWDAEHAQDRLQETAHLPEQIAEALAPDTATWQRTATWFRTDGGTTVLNPVTTRSVTRMLTTDSGREIARRLIAGAAAARRAGTLTAGSETPPQGEEGEQDFMQQAQGFFGGLAGGDVMQTMRATLVRVLRSEDGAAILNNPQAMDVLYSGVYAFTGIEFTNGDALRTYMGASGLSVESRRELLVGMMGNAQQVRQTFSKLIEGAEPFASRDLPALHTLINSIDATSLPTEMRDITSLQGLTLEQFRDATPMIIAAMAAPVPQAESDSEGSETGEEASPAPTAPAAIAALLTAEGATGAGLVALASRRDDVPAALHPLVSDAAHADALIALANTMRDGDFAAFLAATDPVNIDEITRIASQAENFQALRTFNTYIAAQTAEGQPLAAWAAGDGSEIVERLRTLTSMETPEQVQRVGAALSGMDEAGIDALDTLRGALSEGHQELFEAFFDDANMESLATPANVTGLLAAIQETPEARNNPILENEATVRAAINLLGSIDRDSGSERLAEEGLSEVQLEREQRVEDNADAHNARMMAFIAAMTEQDARVQKTYDHTFRSLNRFRVVDAEGNVTAAEVSVEELSSFFRENREHLRTFFRTEGVGGDSPVFAALRRRFWEDDAALFGRSTAGGREGLIVILQEPDALSQLLGLMSSTRRIGLTETDIRSLDRSGDLRLGLGVDTRIIDNQDALAVLGAAMGEDATVDSVVAEDVRLREIEVARIERATGARADVL